MENYPSLEDAIGAPKGSFAQHLKDQIAKEKALCPSDATACSPTWRSLVFWNSDIEDVMDRIANEAMGYHPDSRQAFFGDVIAAIHSHLENASMEAREKQS